MHLGEQGCLTSRVASGRVRFTVVAVAEQTGCASGKQTGQVCHQTPVGKIAALAAQNADGLGRALHVTPEDAALVGVNAVYRTLEHIFVGVKAPLGVILID